MFVNKWGLSLQIIYTQIECNEPMLSNLKLDPRLVF